MILKRPALKGAGESHIPLQLAGLLLAAFTTVKEYSSSESDRRNNIDYHDLA